MGLCKRRHYLHDVNLVLDDEVPMRALVHILRHRLSHMFRADNAGNDAILLLSMVNGADIANCEKKTDGIILNCNDTGILFPHLVFVHLVQLGDDRMHPDPE